jgi:hypothetical protein
MSTIDKKWGFKELSDGKLASVIIKGIKSNYVVKLKNDGFTLSDTLHNDPKTYLMVKVSNNKIKAAIEIDKYDTIISTFGSKKDVKEISNNYCV